jgi:hypothetical protein
MPQSTTVFMGTTEVPAATSRNQIMALLVERGAENIAMEYTARRVTGLSFGLVTTLGLLHFALPLRVEPIFAILQSQRKYNRTKHESQDIERAERIAWRQLLRWMEAQMALIDLGMVEDSEVFLPYALERSGKTMFQIFAEQKRITAPKEQG